MTELEAAQAIAAGKLPSPYKFSNMTLFAVRVTGTGMAYRDSLDEFVWRDPSLYLNDEFLARVAGLPLIWEHPVKGSLNSKEFGKRIIGTCMFGYIDGEDVWAIARVYDDEAIKLMTEGQLSTSPGVVFGPSDGNVSGKTEDGETLLVEGRPSTLCHLAVCEIGVWDKGQAPSGILNDTLPDPLEKGSLGMAETEKADAEKSRHDAAMNEKLDAFMDAMHAKMDAAHAKLDAFEKEKKDSARRDSARKDRFGHRKDGEKHDAWKKRHDEDEAAMADAMRKDGADEKDCMDSAKRARHDAEEEERRHDKDFEKWAKEEEKEPEHKEDKRKDSEEKKDAHRKDEEAPEDKKEEKKEEKAEKEEEKPDSRKDSAAMRENEELKVRLARLESQIKGFTAETPGEERDRLAAAQSRADSVMAQLGDRAPAPIAGEQSLDYRRRMLKRLAPHSPQFKNSRFDSLDSEQLTVIEDRVYADAADSARAIGDAKPGMLFPIDERWRDGRTITRFHGDIGAFMAPFVRGGISGKIHNPKGN